MNLRNANSGDQKANFATLLDFEYYAHTPWPLRIRHNVCTAAEALGNIAFCAIEYRIQFLLACDSVVIQTLEPYVLRIRGYNS